MARKPRYIIGQKFGHLTAISESYDSKNRKVIYCQCDCGKYCSVFKNNLLAGITKSCGHLRWRRDEPTIIGKRFGKLVVLSATDVYLYGARKYECQCDCGKKTLVTKGSLVHGDTKSCGCLKHQKGIKRSYSPRKPFAELTFQSKIERIKRGMV